MSVHCAECDWEGDGALSHSPLFGNNNDLTQCRTLENNARAQNAIVLAHSSTSSILEKSGIV